MHLQNNGISLAQAGPRKSSACAWGLEGRGGAGTLDNVRLGGVQEEEGLPVFGGPGINKASLTRQPFSLCCRLPFMGYCHPFPVGNAW